MSSPIADYKHLLIKALPVLVLAPALAFGFALLAVFGRTGSSDPDQALREMERRAAIYNEHVHAGRYEEAIVYARKKLTSEFIRFDDRGRLIPLAGVKHKRDTTTEPPPAGLTYGKVTQTFQRKVDELWFIRYENGELLKTTWSHPFYIEGRGWVKAKELRPGDLSRTESGRPLEIVSVERKKLDEPVTVYNFTVDPQHNYFVGESGILVHNAEYVHVANRRIVERPLSVDVDPDTGARYFVNGLTVPEFDWEYNVSRNPDGSYSVKMNRFEVETTVVINSNAEWDHIREFGRYYRLDGNYTIRDYQSGFNTKEGTIYHERLHQRDMSRELEKIKPVIERSIATIRAPSPQAAQQAANHMLRNFKIQLNKNMGHKFYHDQIKVAEWQYYHRKYEEYKRKSGQ